MTRNLLTLFILVTFNVLVVAQSWVQKASLPTTGKRAPIASTIGLKVYAGLGSTGISNTYVNDFWEYDIPSNTWLQKANYPGAGPYGSTSFAINGKIYVCLGFSSTYVCQNDLWEYDPETNTWTQKLSFPGAARYGARAFVIGDSAFVVGGSTNNAGNYRYDVYMYKPATNTWVQKADYAGGKCAWGTGFSINGIGYFGTGVFDSGTFKKDFWKYDPITNTWASIPDFPGSARGAAVAFVVNNKAYVGLGDYPSMVYNDFGIYDPISNSWQQDVLPVQVSGRTGCIAFSSGSMGYIGLGANMSTKLNDLWAYGTTGVIQGNISYDNSESTPLSGVTVLLKQGNTVIDTAITNTSGIYSFDLVPSGTYTIHCTSNAPWGGVNATDALIIAQHFVNFFSLTGLKLKAADVSNSGSINAIDSQLCSKRFVMLINSFPAGDWVFDEPNVTINSGNTFIINLKGLCYGDVNGSYLPPY